MFAHNLTVKKSYFSIELLWLKIERHLDLIVAPQWLTKLQNDRSIWLYGSRNRAKRDEIVIIKALKYNKIIRHSRQLWLRVVLNCRQTRPLIFEVNNSNIFTILGGRGYTLVRPHPKWLEFISQF